MGVLLPTRPPKMGLDLGDTPKPPTEGDCPLCTPPHPGQDAACGQGSSREQARRRRVVWDLLLLLLATEPQANPPQKREIHLDEAVAGDEEPHKSDEQQRNREAKHPNHESRYSSISGISAPLYYGRRARDRLSSHNWSTASRNLSISRSPKSAVSVEECTVHTFGAR
jgi:hypothetical protein